MLDVYQALIRLALAEFGEIITRTVFIGGTPASPNKLRLLIKDGSFLDIWLSGEGDYSYHWEQRPQSGRLYRWDNAPHHPQIRTFPLHMHDGDESTIIESDLNSAPENALRQILGFVREHLPKRE
jgi:hypothetical protein